MLPFISQPAVASACYVPRTGSAVGQSQVFSAGYLARVQAAGNMKIFSASAWIERSAMGALGTVLSVTTATFTSEILGVAGDGPPYYSFCINSSFKGVVVPTPGKLLRDGSAFAHVYFTLNRVTGQASIKVNGISVSVSQAVIDNVDGLFNAAGASMVIGRRVGGGYNDVPLSGLMADVIYVDGAEVPASAFGEFNIHGVWVPKSHAETYAAVAAAGGFGVNGFHLDFAQPLNPGNDVSGRGNHFTATGFDAAGKDTVASSPTNVYATLSPLYPLGSTATLSNANLTCATGGSGTRTKPSSMVMIKGKWRWKVTPRAGSEWYIGIARPDFTLDQAVGSATAGGYSYWHGGQSWNNGVNAAYGAVYGINDEIDVLLDLDAGTLTYRKNGVNQGVAFTGLVGPFVAIASESSGVGEAVFDFNFGQRVAVYGWQTGYSDLCTDNLPEPEVKDPAEGFADEVGSGANILALLDASTAHWNGAAYVEIIKRTDLSENWRWRFSDDAGQALSTNTTAGKIAAPALTAGGSYVGHRLRVGQRFGVWTAAVTHVNGLATTVTHGLGTSRNAVILKPVGVAGGDWLMRHPDMPAGTLGKLNSDAVAVADSTMAAFGADSFQIAATAPSGTYRVQVLAQRDGYLDLGKYHGNGSADGVFVPMTLSPLLVITKVIAGAPLHPCLLDAARSPANPVSALLQLDSPVADSVGTARADFVVGGVKLRSTTLDINQFGIPYCTIAIGRPIGGVCVAPATAR